MKMATEFRACMSRATFAEICVPTSLVVLVAVVALVVMVLERIAIEVVRWLSWSQRALRGVEFGDVLYARPMESLDIAHIVKLS